MSKLDELYDRAIRDTIQRLEETGSPVITDGEQTKPSFATYPIHGFQHLAPDGVSIAFEDGPVRQLTRLTGGPFRYQTYADSYLLKAQQYAHVPVKQAVISASALSFYTHNKELKTILKRHFLKISFARRKTISAAVWTRTLIKCKSILPKVVSQ